MLAFEIVPSESRRHSNQKIGHKAVNLGNSKAALLHKGCLSDGHCRLRTGDRVEQVRRL